MSNSVITTTARKKLAQARKGEISLPVVAGIALGDGAENDGVLRTPLAEDVNLNNEIVRKEYASCTKTSDTSYCYRINLESDELAGKTINEAALYDADGDLIAIRTFKGKIKDNDMEMAFEYDDIF